MLRGALALRRPFFLAAIGFCAVVVVAVAGAYPRYNRLLFGAPPLALALVCFAIAAFLGARNGKRYRRRQALAAVLCLLLLAALAAVLMRPSLIRAGERERLIASEIRPHVLLTLHRDRVRAALYAELQPVDVPDCRIERFGDSHDGGYLMCGNLLGAVQAGYSYGVGYSEAWGCEISRRLGVPVHQYDCFDARRYACPGGTTTFHDECVGPARATDGSGREFDTLENQLTRNGHAATHVVMKMDIEGAEWESLAAVPTSILQRIDQLALEIHGVSQQKYVDLVRRLKEQFHLVNVHYNNYECMPRLDPLPARIVELLFVNKRVADAAGPKPRGPHPLDTPSNRTVPDCQTPTSRWHFGDLRHVPTLFR